MRENELEAILVEIGERLASPRRPLAAAVLARIERTPLPRRWSAPSLAPALATLAALLFVVALAIPGVRAAAREILHIGGIDIFPVPSLPASPTASTSASPSASPSLAIPGRRTTLAVAQAAVPFAIRVPTAAELGTADEIVLDTSSGPSVSLVYATRPQVPASRLNGVAALVVELPGTVDPAFFGKLIGPGTTVTSVDVNGSPGYWLEGAPHQFFYRDSAGSIRDETLRLAGNTLIWVADGVTYRLEAQLSRADALRIAASFR